MIPSSPQSYSLSSLLLFSEKLNQLAHFTKPFTVKKRTWSDQSLVPTNKIITDAPRQMFTCSTVQAYFESHHRWRYHSTCSSSACDTRQRCQVPHYNHSPIQPGAKSHRVAHNWCNSSAYFPLWNFKLQFVNKVLPISTIRISDHWPNSICNRCLFVLSLQSLFFISPVWPNGTNM